MPAKKTKESEPVQGLDSFAPLDITTKDVRTAVLMLDSTEDALIAQVCEAIYKYASTSDANRTELLSLDLLPRLVSKLRSPEKAIRAHAAMCMASLSCLPQGRRAIGDLDCYQLLTALLVEEEEAVTKEVGVSRRGTLLKCGTGHVILIIPTRLYCPDLFKHPKSRNALN